MRLDRTLGPSQAQTPILCYNFCSICPGHHCHVDVHGGTMGILEEPSFGWHNHRDFMVAGTRSRHNWRPPWSVLGAAHVVLVVRVLCNLGLGRPGRWAFNPNPSIACELSKYPEIQLEPRTGEMQLPITTPMKLTNCSNMSEMWNRKLTHALQTRAHTATQL